jgi:hypothetical protein
VTVRRRVAHAGLAVLAAGVAFAVWAGLAGAGSSSPPSDGRPSVVLTQTDPGSPSTDGHRCHKGDGDSPDTPAPSSARNSSASV